MEEAGDQGSTQVRPGPVSSIGYESQKEVCADALVGRLSWLECCPVHQNVVGSIPNQSIHLG